MNTTHNALNTLSANTFWADALEPLPTVKGHPWLARLRQAWTDSAYLAAQSRAESGLWEIGQGDPRVMAELMLARKGADKAQPAQANALSEMTEPDTVATVVPKAFPLLGQGWARAIEDAYQTRTRNALWRYA